VVWPLFSFDDVLDSLDSLSQPFGREAAAAGEAAGEAEEEAQHRAAAAAGDLVDDAEAPHSSEPK
jgi:hypothetical protein